jgi:hypothetical protein
MQPNWLIKDKLCCFADDTVRIEIGPQYVELEVSTENLSDEVTHPSYQLDKPDAFGKKIGLSKMMTVVDRKGKLVPHLWKVYEMQEVFSLDVIGNKIVDDDGETVMINRFIKIDEKEDFDDALAIAESLVTT